MVSSQSKSESVYSSSKREPVSFSFCPAGLVVISSILYSPCLAKEVVLQVCFAINIKTGKQGSKLLCIISCHSETNFSINIVYQLKWAAWGLALELLSSVVK